MRPTLTLTLSLTRKPDQVEDAKPVVAMEEDLMVGVFSDGLHNETGFLMLVDLRTSTQRNDLPPRTTNVTLAAACTASAVPGGTGGGGWIRSVLPARRGRSRSIHLECEKTS